MIFEVRKLAAFYQARRGIFNAKGEEYTLTYIVEHINTQAATIAALKATIEVYKANLTVLEAETEDMILKSDAGAYVTDSR